MKSLAEILGKNQFIEKQRPRRQQTSEISAIEQAEAEKEACPVCKGRGYVRREVPIDHPDFGKAFPCRCRKVENSQQKIESLRKISNLDLMTRFTFDSFDLQKPGTNQMARESIQHAYDITLNFAADPEGWLLLLGGYGCGKTHLAAAIANQLVEQRQLAIFVVVPDLLDYLRATYDPQGNISYDNRFQQIRQAPVLILDDLGSHSATPWAQEKLFQIFNYRYNARLPTVVTTNHSLNEIDMRVRSRLTDQNLTTLVEIMGTDMRQGGELPYESELSTLHFHKDKMLANFDLRKFELEPAQVHNLEQMHHYARKFVNNPEDWLVISGNYGCGKTHIAAAIANEIKAKGEQVLFVSVPDLLDYLRAAFSPHTAVPYDKRFEEVRTVPILVLDDLGTESATPWVREKLYQIFNYRYNARLPTVITVTQDSTIHPRIKAMLLDVGRCDPFLITAPSYRHGNKALFEEMDRALDPTANKRSPISSRRNNRTQRFR